MVDIQDTERYKDQINYFKDIMGALTEHDIVMQISIFLHKYDPFVELSSNRVLKAEAKYLKAQLVSLIPPEYPIKIYITSVYTVFRKMELK